MGTGKCEKQWQNSCQETVKLHLALSESDNILSDQSPIIKQNRHSPEVQVSIYCWTPRQHGAVWERHLQWNESENMTPAAEWTHAGCCIWSLRYLRVWGSHTLSLWVIKCVQKVTVFTTTASNLWEWSFSKPLKQVKSWHDIKLDPFNFHNTH